MKYVDTNGKIYNENILQEVEISARYEGYIKNELKEAEEMKKLESIPLSLKQDYNMVPNLAIEARQKLNNIKPQNIGQASRISGVNPSDISVLIMQYKLGNLLHD